MKSPNRVDPLSRKIRQDRAAEAAAIPVSGTLLVPKSGPTAASGPIAVKDPSEIVSERVLRLRASIANGTYQVSSLHVADKLIEHMLRRGAERGSEIGAELETETGSGIEDAPETAFNRDPRKPHRRS